MQESSMNLVLVRRFISNSIQSIFSLFTVLYSKRYFYPDSIDYHSNPSTFLLVVNFVNAFLFAAGHDYKIKVPSILLWFVVSITMLHIKLFDSALCLASSDLRCLSAKSSASLCESHQVCLSISLRFYQKHLYEIFQIPHFHLSIFSFVAQLRFISIIPISQLLTFLS